MGYFANHGLALSAVRRLRRWRRKLFNAFLRLKLKDAKRIDVDPSAVILGLQHMSIGSHFRAGLHLRMEAHTKYGTQALTPRLIIKDDVQLEDFVHIGVANHVEIGNHVLMASKVYISDHNHGFYTGEAPSDPEMAPAKRPLDATRKVIIEDNVWLGEFVSVMPGVTIGRGSIIGANSVVTKDIPPYSIAVGAPAKVVKRYDATRKAWIRV